MDSCFSIRNKSTLRTPTVRRASISTITSQTSLARVELVHQSCTIILILRGMITIERMFTFSSFEDVTLPSMGLPRLLETDEATSCALWLTAGVLFHLLVAVLRGGDFSWSGLKESLSFRVSSQCFSNACPKRRARWYKCAKRCAKKSIWDDECPLTKCAMNLIKQHLPPPLPLKPKTKKFECAPMKPSATSDTPVSPLPSDKNFNKDAGSVGQASTMQSLLAQPAAPLIDLARMQYWESVAKQASRRGAKYRDSDGLYPLHWAVSGGPPLEVVQALLDAYPSAARKTDREGSTALHFATHYSASPAIVDALLKIYPKAAMMQDRYGRTPLYHAVEKGAGIEVLSKLLSSNPSVAMLPCLPHGKRNIPMSRAVAERTPIFMVWSAVLLDRKCKRNRRGKKWDKAQLLLESAYLHLRKTKPPLQHPYTFLFAAIALDVYLPEDIVPMAVTMHPEHLQMQDECTGRFPLSQAASTTLLSRQRADDLIALLLQKYPTAVESVDFQGKSALHLAVASGKSWAAGVRRLVEANPEAIHWVAQSSGLSPALAAATSEVTIVNTPAPKEVTDENPLGLLTSKEKEIIRRRRKQLLQPTGDEEASTETEHVSTVLQLLLLDPSMVPRLNK